ncbi:MAG: Verru_Chthon cassette protein B [Candidatus Methylacidiphilales bacterium]|nr:Verru_Chthon cassette protein B [Candidatus Methylacidiphilales bacterium]
MKSLSMLRRRLALLLNQRCRRRTDAGFSLIEVVLALGVVSVALLPLTGMLFVGLRIFDQAVSTTTQGEIAQQVVNQLQQSAWVDTNLGVRNLYFSQEGVVTTSAQSIFTATVSQPESFSLPGSGSASPNVQRIRVDITSRFAPNQTNTFTVHLANNRQ